MESDQQLVARFIDLVVLDKSAAEVLDDNPWLRTAKFRLGESVLHFIEIEGTIEDVHWLLDRGLDFDSPNEFDDTAFIESLLLGNVGVAKLLIDAGANLRHVSPGHGNILDIAEASDKEHVRKFVETIVKSNPNSPQKPKYGCRHNDE